MLLRRYFSVVAGLITMGGVAVADVIPPGQKSIVHNARFENLGDYPDYVFFIAHSPYARHSNRDKTSEPFAVDAQRLDPGDATTGLTRNPIMGGLYLLAVPKKLAENPNATVMSDWFDGKTPGILQATVGSGVRSAPESERRIEYWTNFRVEIKDGLMTLTRTRDDNPGNAPAGVPDNDSIRWYIGGGLAAFAVVLLVGCVVYYRRK